MIIWQILSPLGALAGLFTLWFHVQALGSGDEVGNGFLFGIVLGPLLATGLAALVGIPIRLSPVIRLWWIRHAWVAWFGVALSLAVVGFSYLIGSDKYGYNLNGDPYIGWRPDLWSGVVGALFLAFFLLHSWWPQKSAPAEPRRSDRLPVDR